MFSQSSNIIVIILIFITISGFKIEVDVNYRMLLIFRLDETEIIVKYLDLVVMSDC